LKDCFTKEPLSPGDVFCVTKVVFSPDGKKIAALGAQRSIIFVWDISGNLLNNFNKSEFEITDIVFSPDSQQIGMVSSENITWNKALKDELRQASNTLLNVFKGNNGLTISSVAFAPDGRLIAIGGEDGSVHLWDTVRQPLPKPQRLDSKQCGKFSNLVAMVGFSPDGRQIATGTEDGLVCLWDISGKLVGKIDRFKKDNFNGLGFTPDNKLLVALKNKNNSIISLVDSSGIPAIKFKNSDSRADTPPDKCNVYSFAFSHDGQRIATGGFHHDICLWDTSGKLLHKFKEGHLSEVPSIAFSPNGQLIVTAGVEGNALLWDISGKQLNQFAKEQIAVAGVAFSPDGQQIATGGGMKGQNVLLSDTSGKQLAKFNFEDVVPSVAFSQDGLEIATKADDGNIFLWRVALNIDQLLSMNCDWLRDYLKNNSKVSKSDRYLCDEIGSQK
jgi:WD40 repeat protein